MTIEGANAVLIVDNDDHVLKALGNMLEKEGFHAQTTWSGHEALARLQSRRFEVLLVGDYLADLHSTDFLKRAGKLEDRQRWWSCKAARRHQSSGAVTARWEPLPWRARTIWAKSCK